MARLILSVGGAIIGGIIGGPTGARYGWMIGSAIGSYVDPQIIKGPKIGDVSAQTSRDGVPRPIVFGTAAVFGNLIDRGDVDIVKERERQGKGGPVVVTERAYLTFAIRICEGPIEGILRVWEDDKLVYDARPDSEIVKDSAKWKKGVRFYLGDLSQLPDPDLEAIHGVGTTPAYRGTAYAVFVRKDITNRLTSLPQFRFEVAASATVTAMDVVYSLVVTPFADATYPRQYIATNNPADWSGSVLTISGTGNGNTNVKYINNTLIINDADKGWKSDDFGVTWEEFTLPSDASEYMAGDGQVFIVGAITAGTPGVYTSETCETGSWTFRELPATAFNDYDFVSARPGALFAFGRYQIYVSYDQGATWTFQSDQDDWSANIGFAALDRNGRRLVAGGFHGLIAYSDDDWLTRETQTLDDSGFYFEVVMYGTGGRWVAASTSGKVWYSTDNGVSWTLADDTLADTPYSGVWHRQTGQFVIIGNTGKVWTSGDGNTWGERGPTAFTTARLNEIAMVPIGLDEDLDRVEGDGVTLSAIVLALSARVGLDSSQLDVSELTDTVTGYVVAGTYGAGDAIKPLQRTFFFDPFEADKQIIFRKRGGASVVSLTEDDLVELPEKVTREQEVEFPKKLHLHYQNAELAYAPTKETAQRSSPDVRVVGEISVEVPVVLTGDAAAPIACKMHKGAWDSATGPLAFAIADNYAYLTPTDIVTLALRDKTRRLRIEKIDTADGILRIEALRDRITSYSSDATGKPLPEPLPPGGTFGGEATLHVMNISSLIDAHDKLGYYVIAAGVEDGYRGARIQRSVTAGSTWEDLADIAPGAILGTVYAAFGDHSPYVIDSTNTLRVQLLRDDLELESIDQNALLNNNNAALVGDELICFRDATEESPGIWALSVFLRGRLATESVAHVPGERFVLLDSAVFVDAPVGLIGANVLHRAVPFGESPELAEQTFDNFDPMLSQTEWAPVDLDLTRSGSNLTATWLERARFGNSVQPVHSVNFLGYRVTLTKGANTATFDIAPGVATFTYDTSALGAAPVDVSIAGINRITGASPFTLDGSA